MRKYLHASLQTRNRKLFLIFPKRCPWLLPLKSSVALFWTEFPMEKYQTIILVN